MKASSCLRRQREKGWGPPRKDQDGKPVCRRCAGPLGKGRRTFCGDECVHEWRLRTDTTYVRQKVYDRDHGVCAYCRVETCAHRKWKSAQGTGRLWQADHIVPVVEGGGECGLDNYRTLCTACHKTETALLRKRLASMRLDEQEALDFSEVEVTT